MLVFFFFLVRLMLTNACFEKVYGYWIILEIKNSELVRVETVAIYAICWDVSF